MAVKEARVKALVDELKELYLRAGNGREAGLYFRMLPVVTGARWDGHIDQDTRLLIRIKEIVEELGGIYGK